MKEDNDNLVAVLAACYSFYKRFYHVMVETGNSLLLDYFREYDGLPTRIKETIDKLVTNPNS